jgi:hypothetical protein
MQVAIVQLSSIPGSSYSASKYISVPKTDKERSDDFEARTWKERCNYDPKTRLVFIPAMAFKKSLDMAASFLSEKIKGQKNATFTKHFRAGVLVTSSLTLPVKMDDVEGEWFMVPSDGKPGGSSRVPKCFPVIREWAGTVKYFILDATITEDVFVRTLGEAGNFIGVGRFRPERGGFYGRYQIEKVKWQKD